MHTTLKPSFWLAVVLILSAEGALLSLAHWQHGRMKEKEELLTSLQQGSKTALATEISEDTIFQKTEVTGKFDYTRSVFLANQMQDEAPVWRVLTPMVMSDNQEIVVDRGWLTSPQNRLNPDISAYREGSSEKETTIKGVIRKFPENKGLFKGADTNVEPYVLLRMSEEAIPTSTVNRNKNVYIQATTATHPNLKAEISLPLPPSRHKMYRNTWLAMALLLPLLSVGLLRRKSA
ncbi:MAG: SURF1 family protein [Alphaproteobacteria bacterium]|nr:SURF1 family protein [Alphaproteobacteria bacterium]MDD9920297.1 SURF1 family protein [Alphaproteobacteria bacterium]